ncbi:MAG: inorganic diphosphatase [Anaplasmataceae bacterium]|nr:inorganic diphosphatase [Anaplasmataceae bacterium]
MSIYNNIPASDNGFYNIVVEISANNNCIKYEIDPITGVPTVDRFINVSMVYPCNYGFIPHTKGEDGDCADALIITRLPLMVGCVIKCKLLGMMLMEDEGGIDTKFVFVPADKIDPTYKDINDIDHLPSALKDSIYHFFSHYKDHESGKHVTLNGWKGCNEARIMLDSLIK